MSNLLFAVVTAYTWTGNLTAAGDWPVAGVTVAAPRSVPLGTRVYIEGVGPRVVQDRMHRRFADRWDVYFNNKQEAVAFGKQRLRVRVMGLAG
jgi:3D (Asp-Asp-Asp) domain-containing protein